MCVRATCRIDGRNPTPDRGAGCAAASSASARAGRPGQAYEGGSASLLPPPLATGGVPRRGHGDERAGARALRAHRGRGGARRRRRAARPLVLAGGVSRRCRAASSASPGSRRRWSTRRRRPRRVLPELGRGCAGGCWSPTRRASTAACCGRRSPARRSTGPQPPVLCTVALARRLRAAAAAPRAGGARRRARHRGRGQPPRAAGCGDVRARVLRAVPALCATRRRSGRPWGCCGPRRGARAPRPRAARAGARARAARPLARCRKDPGVYVFRDADGHPLYVGKSVCLRTRARSHFTTPAAWTGQAEHVDYQATQSELGALVLENRLIKALKPPGNKRLKSSPTGWSTSAAGSTSRSRSSRWRASRRRGHASRSGRCAGAPRPPSWSSSSTRCSACATAGASCRAATTRPPTGRWAAACRPACATWTPTSTASASTRRSRSSRARDGGGAARPRRGPDRAASDARRYERAAWLRRAARGSGAPVAPRRRAARGPRGRAAGPGAAPVRRGRYDALWIAGGRVVDWGALPEARRRSSRGAGDALRARRAARPAAGCRPTRSTRRASSARGWPPTRRPSLELTAGTGPDRLARFVAVASRAPARASGRAQRSRGLHWCVMHIRSLLRRGRAPRLRRPGLRAGQAPRPHRDADRPTRPWRARATTGSSRGHPRRGAPRAHRRRRRHLAFRTAGRDPGDWDLALFDAAGRKRSASANGGSTEQVSGWVAAGDTVILQACRRTGGSRAAGVTRTASSARCPRPTEGQLVQVRHNGLVTSRRSSASAST